MRIYDNDVDTYFIVFASLNEIFTLSNRKTIK